MQNVTIPDLDEDVFDRVRQRAAANRRSVEAELRDIVTRAVRPLSVEEALAASLEIDHPVYDCLYLMAGVPLRGVCLTADRKLVSRAGRTRFAPNACALAEVDSVIANLGLT